MTSTTAIKPHNMLIRAAQAFSKSTKQIPWYDQILGSLAVLYLALFCIVHIINPYTGILILKTPVFPKMIAIYANTLLTGNI